MNHITVYKASAGSGKTFTLAIEYIKLLVKCNPQEYLHTLAVTFTNKATAEMKDRILEQLYGIGNGLADSNDYLEALQRSLREDGEAYTDEQIRKNCRTALKFILHDYSRFRIETIDSFFQSVLRNLAHELGLSARLQVDLNDAQILSQAVDNLVDGLGKKGENDMLPWIDQYVKEQLENDEGWDVRGKIKALSALIFKEDYMKRGEEFRNKIDNEQEIEAYRKKLYTERARTKEALKRMAEEFCQTVANYDGDIPSDVSRGSWIIDYKEALREGKFRDIKLTDNRTTGINDPIQLVKKADQGNPVIVARVEALAKAIRETEEKRNKHLFILNTIDLSLQHLSPLRLLRHIEEEVTEITSDNDRFILAKTPILLSKMINGSDAPFILEKMGTLFHHVMIDEFQDTSRMQWDNFKVLLLESTANGGSDLLVGDIKQSIYRFRGGDWHILKNIGNELNLDEQKDIKPLETNFRSDANVIDFNNKFFLATAPLMGPEEGENIPQEIYSDVVQKWPAKKEKERQGFVRVMLERKRDRKKKGDEAPEEPFEWEECMLDDMCQQIKTLHEAGLPYSEMCVLLRNRNHVDTLIGYVQSHLKGVSMVSDEGFKLQSSPSLLILIATLRMLCYGEQDPVSERYLVKHYLTDVLHQEPTIETVINTRKEDVLPEAFVENIEQLRQYPLNELCETLYSLLNLKEIKGDDAYVLCFFDELQKYLSTESSDLVSFLDYWDSDMAQHAIPACKVNGISIVTIHKSKGLQYHTVFMPYCDQPLQTIKTGDILWCTAESAPYNEMGTLPINGSQDRFENSEYGDDYLDEQLQRRIEELNILYVAFTRAEHNLYVWSKNGDGDVLLPGTILKEALTENEEMKGAMTFEEGTNTYTWTYKDAIPVTALKEKKEENKENRLHPSFEEEDIRFLSYNRRFDFRQSNEADQYILHHGEEYDAQNGMSFIEQGKLLHEIFSTIITTEDIEPALQSYLDRGILQNGQEVNRIRRLIDKGLQNEQVRSWFSGEMEVINECDIAHVDKDGKAVTTRPDRLMVTPDEVIVVDFKFGRPNPDKYHPQVQGYMSLMQQMYPDRRVTGYLWYVYRNEIDPVTL